MVGERDYSQLTPLERKAELSLLFQRLPKVSAVEKWVYKNRQKEGVLGEKVVSESSDVPEDSRYSVVLASRFRALLSSSYLTPSLQDYLTEFFETDASLGYGKSVLRDEPFSLFEVDSEHLGIFEENRAREIARKIINRMFKEELPYEGVIKDEMIERIGAEKVEEHKEYFKVSEALVRARQEFVEKYGEEP